MRIVKTMEDVFNARRLKDTPSGQKVYQVTAEVQGEPSFKEDFIVKFTTPTFCKIYDSKNNYLASCESGIWNGQRKWCANEFSPEKLSYIVWNLIAKKLSVDS